MNIEEDPGAIRLSFLHYTTHEDVNKLISGLKIALG
jgi:selenocysteine lyase/cysteine desulfurase